MAKPGSQAGIFAVLGLAAVALVVWRFWPQPPPLPAAVPPTHPAQLSEAVDLDVYLDGSGSMRQFLEDGPAGKGGAAPAGRNYFRDFLEKSELALHNASGEGGWHTVQSRFFRFGTAVERIPAEGGLHQLALDPGKLNAQSTRIETAIEDDPDKEKGGARLPEVKIIVTDLYESNSEVEQVTDALADKYLKGDVDAVQILAVRNPYGGTVEDLPGLAPGQSLAKAADSMPFYVIVAGPAADVRNTVEVLLAQTGLDDAFKKNLAAGVYFSRAPENRPGGSSPTVDGTGWGLMSDSYQGSGAPGYQLGQGTVQVSWAPAPPMPGRTIAVGQDNTAEIHVVPGGDQSGDLDAAAAAAGSCSGAADRPCVRLDGTRLPGKATYLYRLDWVARHPSAALRPESASMHPWSIEESDAKQICQGAKQFPTDPPLAGHPGKTPYLSELLTSLQSRMFSNPVNLATYYLYVQAN